MMTRHAADIVEEISTWAREVPATTIVRAAVVLVVGLLIARAATALLARLTSRGTARAQSTSLRKLVFYGLALLSVLGSLRELGFDMSVFLGAAGVLSVALGFASQTSASNLISGLFLIGEGAFQIGDVIEVGGQTGEVLSIDLLSVKLRTFDNLFVRIPNETLVKSNVTNLSRFPIRRIDIVVRIGYGSDLEFVRKLLLEVAENEPRALDEPKPLVFAQEFEATGVRIQFSTWARREVYLEVKTALQAEVRRRLDEEQIATPSARLDVGQAIEK